MNARGGKKRKIGKQGPRRYIADPWVYFRMGTWGGREHISIAVILV